MVKSAYIHIPFCRKICSYCDFCKVFYDKKFINKYLDSLEIEIKNRYKGEVLDTIYIGGGTPSSLSIDELIRLFEIIKIFKLSDNNEFTIEFNVEDISLDKLKICKDNNVNRISIGVESFNKNNLKFLNREVTNIDEKISLVKKYFDNINIDLIYALPTEDLSILEEDLDNILKLDINHVSCYSLIIEKHTKLYNDNIKNIDEDLDFKMYELINKKLEGFNHYEISNYAKKGYESWHNLTYWNNNEYYGFGLGAASYIDNKRIYNSKSLNKYLDKIYDYDEEILTMDDKILYELILGFRKINGINIDDFYNKYNVNILSLEKVKKMLESDKLLTNNNHIFINPKYMYTQNKILIELI